MPRQRARGASWEGEAASWPAQLSGPVPVALAKSAEHLPPAGSLPGGAVYEPKWDGFRCALVAAPAGPAPAPGVRLWSRQGKELTTAFPDIVAVAAHAVPAGTVLDGELVVWHEDRLDFDLLSARLGSGPVRAAQQARAHPASYVVFDVLAAAGTDVRTLPWRQRRAALEVLAQAWEPPLQLSPFTRDEQVARTWAIDLRPAGIEGLVVKAADGTYRPGVRDWVKVKSRETVEVIIGAVTGPVTRPDTLVVGRLDGDGVLRIVGRSTPLTRTQTAAVAPALAEAGPGHPWPAQVAATRFGAERAQVSLTRVVPAVVVEVSADAALSGGTFRHPVRFIRLRPDLDVDDVSILRPP